MPNWCSNTITIRGDVETLSQLKPVLEAGEGLLEAIKPIGEWEYDTAVEAWGTKWDVSTEGLVFVDNGDGTATIEGYFDSAWAPPIEAYNTFLEANEDCSVTASYYEPGMDFAGLYDNGDDEYLEGLHDEFALPEDEQSDLYKRLDEEWGLSEQFEMWIDDENIDIDLDGGLSAIGEDGEEVEEEEETA